MLEDKILLLEEKNNELPPQKKKSVDSLTFLIIIMSNILNVVHYISWMNHTPKISCVE
jgi:hypothetical protein